MLRRKIHQYLVHMFQGSFSSLVHLINNHFFNLSNVINSHLISNKGCIFSDFIIWNETIIIFLVMLIVLRLYKSCLFLGIVILLLHFILILWICILIKVKHKIRLVWITMLLFWVSILFLKWFICYNLRKRWMCMKFCMVLIMSNVKLFSNNFPFYKSSTLFWILKYFFYIFLHQNLFSIKHCQLKVNNTYLLFTAFFWTFFPIYYAWFSFFC